MQTSKLLTVAEAEATGTTLKIYNDIKCTMGVALVNLVWRHLACVPPALNWSWRVLKPLYTSGDLPAAAWLLREVLQTPALDPFSDDECRQFYREKLDLSVLDAVLRTYQRGNAQNLIAMCYLQSCLTPTSNRQVKPPVLNDQQRAAELADRADLSIPPLPDWNTINPKLQSTISVMTDVWVPAAYRLQNHALTPSVFRHMALWPGILNLYQMRLVGLQATSADCLFSMSQTAKKQARRQAMQLQTRKKLPTLPEEDNSWLQGALDLFINGMIAPGVVIVPAMRAALPAV